MNIAPLFIPELNKLLDRVRYVPKRVAHHALHSGYDVLFAACGMKQAYSGLFSRLADWIPKWIAWRVWSLRPQPSQHSGLKAELAAVPWTATGRGHLCHFIYGEDTFLFTPLWKRSKNLCVATVHYPPAVLSQRVNPGSLKSLDAIIIVGENQREWLSKIVGPDKIHFCPHHVDTDFFCPADNTSLDATHFRLVCVGHLFRDYDALLRVLRLLRTRHGHNVSLDVVGLQGHSNHPLVNEPDVRMHRGITDEALRDLYRKATVGILPLTDSTANNALLEMMACGLPIVITDVGGVRDYVLSGGVTMRPPGDSEGFAHAVDALLNDPSKCRLNSVLNRTHAVREFSLLSCGKKLAVIYAHLLG